MSEELKPCAHCAKPGIEVEQIRRGDFHEWSIECSCCYCRTDWYGLRDAAIFAWNRRADDAPSVDNEHYVKVIASVTEGLTSSNPRKWIELSCGHSFMVDGFDVPRCCPTCDALINADDKPDIDMSKSVHMCPNEDSREQLEADVRGAVHGAYAYEDYIPEDMIFDWLDRQALITADEANRTYCVGCEACRAAQKRGLAELQDQVDNLTAELRECDEQRIEYRDQRDYLEAEVEVQRKRANDAERGVLSSEWYVCRDRYEDDVFELQQQVDSLTAERDGLKARVKLQQSQIDAGDLAFDILTHEYGKLDCKCDELRDKLVEKQHVCDV